MSKSKGAVKKENKKKDVRTDVKTEDAGMDVDEEESNKPGVYQPFPPTTLKLGSVRKVWLLKVPKEFNVHGLPPNSHLGNIRIYKKKNEKKPAKITMSVGEGKNFTLKEQNIMEHISIFSEKDETNVKIEGNVVYLANCHPDLDDVAYMETLNQRKEKSEFKEGVKDLENTGPQRKAYNREQEIKIDTKNYNPSAKTEVKYIRKPEEEVRADLFGLFEKQQYYLTRDLQNLTAQPLNHLKTVLSSICVQHTHGTMKDCWELKESYRQDKPDEPGIEGSSDMPE